MYLWRYISIELQQQEIGGIRLKSHVYGFSDVKRCAICNWIKKGESAAHPAMKRDLLMRVKRNHNVRKETCMYASEIACSNDAKSIMRY
jgi:hypothetical protein